MSGLVLNPKIPEKPSYTLLYSGVPVSYQQIAPFIDEYDEMAQRFVNKIYENRRMMYQQIKQNKYNMQIFSTDEAVHKDE